MHTSNNFNAIAPFYDRLCSMVFGNSIYDAQVAALDYIPFGARVLIIGGGTGRILEDICKRQSTGLTITYVEQSED